MKCVTFTEIILQLSPSVVERPKSRLPEKDTLLLSHLYRTSPSNLRFSAFLFDSIPTNFICMEGPMGSVSVSTTKMVHYNKQTRPPRQGKSYSRVVNELRISTSLVASCFTLTIQNLDKAK